ncbi:MAG: CcmD family protein [Sphingomonadales bacterium]|nr:CcmD family protein [Sphingomonadales bacterium]
MNTEEAVTMADTMRSNGKIYVVLAVVLLIQAGLFVMLWSLDRKLSKLEA